MGAQPQREDHQARRGRGWTYAALAGWVLLVEAWFQGPLLGGWAGRGAAAVLLLAVAVLALVRAARSGAGMPAAGEAGVAARREGFVWAVGGMLLLATLVRLPALVAPGSLVSSDSAVAGIIAQELRAGHWPPPIYAPGFPYEGTLKPHVTALLGAALPRAPTPLLYAVASHLFYLAWIAAVMVLARRVAGTGGALAAGAFMAVSPRFLAAFSLNNVGQYPEVNALGTLALALVSGGTGPLGAAFVAGLALWQQLVGVYFVAVLALALLITAEWRSKRTALEATAGLVAGSYPMWAWNATHGFATFDFVRRGGKHPLDRLIGIPERLERTAAVSFPKMFGLTDLGLQDGLALAGGLVLPLLVIAMAWARRREMARERGRSAVVLASALFAVTLAVFVVSKFSHRGVQRPRYVIPLYTPVALAVGWAAAALGRRSRVAATAAVGALLAANTAGLVPWLMARRDAEARDRAFLAGLERLGVRTGYAGFWIGPKYTFLSEARIVLSGELGPDVSWVHPPHAALVRARGPDAFVVSRPDLADALAARLTALGARYHQEDVAGQTVFYGLSRRVSLEDLSGYDMAAPPAEASGEEPEEVSRPSPPSRY